MPRTYSKLTEKAATLLGQQIKLARKERRWSEHNLATRIGISRLTLRKIEAGDLHCEIGLVLEAAVMVGIKLFQSDLATLQREINRTDQMLTLLPQRIRHATGAVDDDF